MTSKEYLQQIATTEVIDCTYNDNSKKRIADIFSVGISVIEKDLEVLDILKNNLYEEKGTGRFKGCNTINCSLGNQHSGIDYTKVKEWLENE